MRSESGTEGRRVAMRLGLVLALGALLAGCVRTTDVEADARIRARAYSAFAVGDFPRARALVARADTYNVPQARLWRRTLELRMALAEDTQRGELRRFLDAWAEQREDWDVAARADAELTLAETLRAPYAADWLYDLETSAWAQPQRTRYNLLRAKLQHGTPALHDDTVARWRLGVKGLYDTGRLIAAANEAARCANGTRNAEAALLAAKLYNEAGDAARKAQALRAAEALAPGDAAVRQEAGQIRTAPLGARSAF